MNAVLHKSERMDWMTPTPILARVQRALGGPIECDPCASSEPGVWFATSMNHTAGDDGLTLQWGRRTFVNPPYGRALAEWMRECSQRWMTGDMRIVALVPARTDTAWFATCWETATAICFWRGRITFVGAPHPAPFPSALVYWGDEPKRFELAMRDAGKVVLL